MQRRQANLALVAVLASLQSASATDLAGRYVVATLPPAADAPIAQAAYAGTADITPRRTHVSTVTWQPAAPGARRLRGLGLSDDDGTLGVSLATGGAAYGVAIYHHAAGSHEWQGRWITSLDGGGTVGDIRFDDAGGNALPGRHRLVCRRPGSGSFEGAVNIVPRGDDFLLTFEGDRTVLYRGLGILLDPDRLVVGWSFGSAPALAVYRSEPGGLVTGRRISTRAGQPAVTREALAREGEDAMRLLPVAARTDPALLRAAAAAELEPGSPEIKAWTYDDLQTRHGTDGWARRWLDEQLTPEERNLLERATHRRRAKPITGRTIGALIEEERRRTGE